MASEKWNIMHVQFEADAVAPRSTGFVVLLGK
jgi:hypothetical protein